MADGSHGRVLEFVSPLSAAMAASLELGEPATTAFTSDSNSNKVKTAIHMMIEI